MDLEPDAAADDAGGFDDGTVQNAALGFIVDLFDEEIPLRPAGRRDAFLDDFHAVQQREFLGGDGAAAHDVAEHVHDLGMVIADDETFATGDLAEAPAVGGDCLDMTTGLTHVYIQPAREFEYFAERHGKLLAAAAAPNLIWRVRLHRRAR